MHYVYLLQSIAEPNWKYVGSCDDLRARFTQHNNGLVRSTKSRKPYVLVYYEAYRSKMDARKREVELKKNWSKKEELLARIQQSLTK